ncbi:TOMM precursor leader peptide-binding protein [Streptomyces sp. AK02-01A]|uniref:TOMM precursor leader peptide-binding protein n=1 Tax=Streptomyces sp. AK02-01A TaxID=3028648 RepID=UPI0029A80956|nr:TOMM precursor leader peptide-binding protein [Streptomyces sp. AK02-01A]MDX3851732.1 TOMM precursor leader peptide-binding protein [Streptomyces sp. AK02-01A]
MDAPILRFPRHVRMATYSGTGVRLVSRERHTLLRGSIGERLAPLLRRGATRAALHEALATSFSAAAVDRALDQLLTAGLAVERVAGREDHDSGLWELAGLDPEAVGDAMRSQAVRLIPVGDPGPGTAALEEAAREQGLLIGTGSGTEALRVVTVDDFLDPRLTALHTEALEDSTAWMVARLTGASAWISPVMEANLTGCWLCLTQRLRSHRETDSLRAAGATEQYPVRGSDIGSATATGLAARLAVLRAAQWIAGLRERTPTLLSFDALTLETGSHHVTRRPQCPGCGDPAMVAAQAHRPLELRGRATAPDTDGGYRASGPDHLLRAYGHLISPVTGVVTGLSRMETHSDLLHVYTAGHNFATNRPRDAEFVRRVLRTESAGKGMTDVQARASALGEAVERYCGVWQGDEAHVTASTRSLGDDAVRLDTLQHFSARQFREREDWRRQGTGFSWVPDPLDETREVSWTPVWSLTENRHKYVPSSYLYYRFPAAPGPVHAVAHSNGTAAGASLEDAVLQGFLELVERDSVALWWYNRVRRPAVRLDDTTQPYLARWRDTYAARDREVWVLDLTSDLGIPVAAAVSRRVKGGSEDILFGFGAHVDPAVAVSRALTEMNQFLAQLIEFRSGPHQAQGGPDAHWWHTATLENQPYLAPDGWSDLLTGPHRRPAGGHDLSAELERARGLVEERGMEMLVLDQTRPDIALPVVRVMVPGLRSFWPQFAPGRLYDVPVSLGWVTAETPEAGLNPVSMFL